MPPTETARDGMLCLSRHENCPWDEALKSADLTWTGLQYTCLKILHLYCKVFEREDVLELVIRKTCKSCGCDRLQHSVYHEELGSVRDRLGLRESRGHISYDNSPPGLTAKQTELYWNALAERAPTVVGGATGPAAWRAWRTRALASQLPRQDLSLSHCKNIDEPHRKQFEDFVAARNEIALDIGIASQHHGSSAECMGCSKVIRSGNIAIQAPRISEEAFFHPACFTCSECDELLVELAYCALDGRLYCVRHYGERLKPRCHACDELFISSPVRYIAAYVPCPYQSNNLSLSLINSSDQETMGLLFSLYLSYVGIHEAIECMKHIISGIVPDTEPNFNDFVEYIESSYTRLLQKTANSSRHWTQDCGLGYLSLVNDKDGKISSATIKYYDRQHNTTALLFSTKISSFGQESIDDDSQINGDIGLRYSPTKTNTIISSASESFSLGQRNKSPTPSKHSSVESDDRSQKLTWEYSPKEKSSSNPPPSPLPEIHFESYSGDKNGHLAFNEDFLRSLDGIKFRPLQRNDPSGRRKLFRKRSSSSNSSKDSRTSREEELTIFTSLEEAEFKNMSRDDNYGGFGSAPNLAARSYSRSRSREKSKERRNKSPLTTLSISDERLDDGNPLLREIPKLSSFEEKDESKKIPEVTEEEDEVDFWANVED